MRDSQYDKLPVPESTLGHEYGSFAHILSHPYAMSLLTRLCAQETGQPEFNHLVGALYDWLLSEVASRMLTREQTEVATRMLEYNPEGVYRGEGIRRDQRVVVCDIARAGIIPSLHMYQGLNHLLDPEHVRLDHVVASRTTDEQGQVDGVEVYSAKIGGPVDDAIVLLPDPMGATGTSMIEVARHYLDQVPGTPRAMAAIHLIVTPEYLAAVKRALPELQVFAVRLDRGLSPSEVLQTVPGTRWSQEVGLNDHQYIVPGGGGFGELMNNAWV